MGSRKRLNLFRKLFNKMFHKNKKPAIEYRYVNETKTFTFGDNPEGIQKFEKFIEVLEVLGAKYTTFYNRPGAYYNVYVETVKVI